MNNLTYNGQPINQRDDGMVNLTQMAQANGKKTSHWTCLDSTKDYIAELERTTGIPASDLLLVIHGGSNGNGTYAHPLLAIEFGRWISPAFAIWCDRHIQRLVATGKTELESNRASLEEQLLLKPTQKEIRYQYGTYKIAFGKAYADRWLLQIDKKYNPALVGESPKPQEMSSLLTAKALLTPTKIAEELSWWCKSNPSKGDARLVNSELARLGYQESVGGRWSATDRAISAGLVDRKPVDTDSRTQKDQLLWSADILPILREHSPALITPTPQD
jgi:hypothetical protein